MNNISLIKPAIYTDIDKTIINGFVDLSTESKDINLSLFTTSLDANIPNKNFPVLPLYESKYEYGTAIVWDIITLDLVKNFPNYNKILFFLTHEVPWFDNRHINVSVWTELFINDRIEIYILSPTMCELFNLTFGKGSYLSNLNKETLNEIL
jgi:hypothetical protein